MGTHGSNGGVDPPPGGGRVPWPAACWIPMGEPAAIGPQRSTVQDAPLSMLWINLCLLAVLAAGHAELLVTLVNRVHALPVPCGRLRHLRHVHDVLIPAFPIALVWWVGIRGPGLLAGGSWADIPWGWRIYLSICGVGVLGLCWSAVRWCLRTIPEVQISNHTEVIDIAARLGRRPVGAGPFRALLHVPGNQAFQLELSRKTYQLRRLPAEWDGLAILHLTDLHFVGTLDRTYFEEVTELAAEQRADMIVFTGDLLDRQHCLEWLPTTLGRLTAPLGCYFILGNHDWYLDSRQIRAELERLNWHDAAGKVIVGEHRGRPLAIGGTERPWMGQHPDFSAAPPEAVRVLLSHTPDHLEWARRQQVDLMLSGHNHGGQVVLPVIGPVYSPSVYGVRYASGVYWREPTLLYVSRGISGRHPLRLNCRPELTTLVLRCAEGRRHGECGEH